MFAHPNSSPGPYGGLKRLHEDDCADLTNSSACGFGEHRNKRHHALPLRSSPLAKRASPPPSFQTLSFSETSQSPPRNITPVSDNEGAMSHISGHQGLFGQCQPSQQEQQPWLVDPVQAATDMDMDMGMAGVETAEVASQDHLQPGAFQPDPIAPSITGRMPTPIQPSFAAQVRGNNWGGAAGNIMQTSSGMQCAHSQATVSGGESDVSAPRSHNHNAMSSWNPVQNRPLPSPISESGGEEVGSPDMILDSVSHFRAQHAAAFSNMPPRSDSTMSLPSYLGDDSQSPELQHGTEHGSPPAAGLNAMDTDSPTTPSPRKGHTRSRHTVNNWTIQPGMKKSFSIGYRADCEKCRNKVPGHFNHIIVS